MEATIHPSPHISDYLILLVINVLLKWWWVVISMFARLRNYWFADFTKSSTWISSLMRKTILVPIQPFLFVFIGVKLSLWSPKKIVKPYFRDIALAEGVFLIGLTTYRYPKEILLKWTWSVGSSAFCSDLKYKSSDIRFLKIQFRRASNKEFLFPNLNSKLKVKYFF